MLFHFIYGNLRNLLLLDYNHIHVMEEVEGVLNLLPKKGTLILLQHRFFFSMLFRRFFGVLFIRASQKKSWRLVQIIKNYFANKFFVDLLCFNRMYKLISPEP